MIESDVRFCPICGNALRQVIVSGRERPTCPECAWTYFPDPKVAVAVLVEDEGRVLLVQRIMQPGRGRWTLPAGFLDAGEDPKQATIRECLEETGLEIRITELRDVIAVQEHDRGAHILILYKGESLSGELTPGDDAGAVAFFSRDDLPPLAFASTETILNDHLE